GTAAAIKRKPATAGFSSGLAQPVTVDAALLFLVYQCMARQLREAAEVPLGTGIGRDDLENGAAVQPIEFQLRLEQGHQATQARVVHFGITDDCCSTHHHLRKSHAGYPA